MKETCWSRTWSGRARAPTCNEDPSGQERTLRAGARSACPCTRSSSWTGWPGRPPSHARCACAGRMRGGPGQSRSRRQLRRRTAAAAVAGQPARLTRRPSHHRAPRASRARPGTRAWRAARSAAAFPRPYQAARKPGPQRRSQAAAAGIRRQRGRTHQESGSGSPRRRRCPGRPLGAAVVQVTQDAEGLGNGAVHAPS